MKEVTDRAERASLRGPQWAKLEAADAYLFEPKICHIMTCQPFLVSYYVGISIKRVLKFRGFGAPEALNPIPNDCR